MDEVGSQRSEAAHAKTYGAILLACAALSVLGMTHHPTTSANDASSLLESLARQNAAILGVHGLLLALAWLQVSGFYGFSRLLGLARPPVATGLIFFGFATMALSIAAATNGFAAPDFAARVAGASPAEAETAAIVLKMNWAHNQAWDRIGTLAWCGAIFSWSLALLRHKGVARLLGVAGLASAAAIAAAVTAGLIRFDAAGFLTTLAGLSSWTVAVAMLMLTGRIAGLAPSRPSREAAAGALSL